MPKRKKIKRKRTDYSYNALPDDYYEKRMQDLEYYLNRSDLTIPQIGKSLGISPRYFHHVISRIYKRPNDFRLQLAIELIKDFERLQTYYAAMLK